MMLFNFNLFSPGTCCLTCSYLTRNRWIQYGKSNWLILDSDASDIPPEWHRWIHYMTDDTPVEVPPTERKFHMEHRPNGTNVFGDRYTPSTTTKPKIEAWCPTIKVTAWTPDQK